MQLYIVATLIEVGDVEQMCDIVLVTEDERKANEMVINLGARNPIPGLNYEMLVPFEWACSFVRTLNKHIGEE